MLSNLKARWLGTAIALDLGLTVLALILARWIREYIPGGVYFDSEEALTLILLDKPLYFNWALLIPLVIVIWWMSFSTQSVYSSNITLNQLNQTQSIFVAVTSATLILAGFAYLFFQELSRFLFLYFYLLDLFFLISWRKLAFHLLKQNRFQMWRPRQRALIVGEGDLAESVALALKSFAWSGLELIGFVNDGPDAVGTLEELPQLVTTQAADEVIFALPPGHQAKLKNLVWQLQSLSVNIRLVPDVIDLVFIRASIEDFAGLPLIGLREPALSAFDRLLKRSLDLVAASLLLLITAPLFLLIVLLIKLNSQDGASVFYTQQRVGEGGKLFSMHKFRTMVVDADQNEVELLQEVNGRPGFNKRSDDTRVTRIGRFLRRSSLDELPQLLNVIKGDMSLVGPRPELPWMVKRYELWQYQRFTVPQGMTGWWQVKNRSKQLEYDVRVEDDLYYIHNYAFLLDLRILLMTMGAMLRGDGAY